MRETQLSKSTLWKTPTEKTLIQKKTQFCKRLKTPNRQFFLSYAYRKEARLFIFGGDAIFLLHLGEVILFLLVVNLLGHLGLLVIEDDEIPVGNIEA